MNFPNPQSTSHTSLGVRRRMDLVSVETHHKHESAVVVKDPIALKYHRMRPDEYFVLEMLDGNTSLEKIRVAYEDRFPPTRVTDAQLNQLLFRFHQNGLTLSDAPMQGDRLTDRRNKEKREKWLQYINGILFIRFPGVDPEPLLRRLYPLTRPFLGRIGMSTAFLICICALTLFAGQWERFGSEFPQMSQWLRFDSLLILACVIGGTKVLHELGHAIACKHFGGECHQIGPMLLVFTPALYCDTSDSWMLPSRWQRAAVGMAGIATEVFLAAIAAFVWAWTAPGIAHYIAMNIMLVCGVSTLLFNANPLLRYDGYYVLSDICDVPNLGEKSRRLLSSRWSKLFLGVEEDTPDLSDNSSHFWLFIYAVAAFCYRWSLTVLILWFVSLILRPYGLESLGRVLCLFAACSMVYTLLRAPLRFLRNPSRRRLIKMKRVAFSLVLLVGLIALAFYPLPASVSQSARIVPREETPIYISTAGQLGELLAHPGQSVSEGDELVRLINPEVELQCTQASGRLETQRKVVESVRRSQFERPEAANELPSAEALLEDLQKQYDTRKSRLDGLVLRAPASGKLIAAPRRAESPPNELIEQRLVSWSGYPTDPENQNCFLQSGSELMSIALSDDWDAEITLDQNSVQRIENGATVKLALESNPSVIFFGKVSDISQSQWNEDENAQRRDDPSATRSVKPAATSYVVRIQLDKNDLDLVTGTNAMAKIDALPISLAGRARRLINSMFRFR